MSKKNQTFRTLGQRMQLFGRSISRNYSGEQPVQLAPAEPSRPRGQWRSMTNNNLIWRQEQPPHVQMPDTPMDSGDYSDYDGGDFQDQPVQRRQQPQQAPRRERPQGQNRVQRQPQNQPPANTGPSYVQTDQGTPVQVSRKQFSSPLQRRLEAILDAHAARDAERDQVREQRREVVERKESDSDIQSTRRRRRGNLSVDYVETTSLLPPEERAKAAQAQAMESSESAETTERSSSSESQSDADDDDDSDSEWFDSVPDDDDDIDDIAGFEAQSDDVSGIQRAPDLSYDADDNTDDDEGDVDNDDMGEFDSGESYPSQNLLSNDQQTIARDEDDAWDDSQQPTADFPSMPTDPTAHIQRAPMLDFDLPEFDENDYGDDETVPLIPQYRNPETPSQTDSPVQRQVNDFDEFDEIEESFDADDDMHADFGENFPPSTQNPPIQRAPRIDPPTDQPDRPRAPWDVTPNRSKSPVQRLPRFDEDEEDISDLDTEKTDFSQAFNDVSGAEPSIQRSALPADDYEDADFEEFADSDFDTGDRFQAEIPDVNATPTDNTPIQRTPMQSNDFDESFEVDNYEDADYAEYDDGDFDAGDSYQSEMPDINPAPSDQTPVQRSTIQREYDEDFDSEYDDDTNYGVEPTAGQSPSGDSPIQRSPLPYNEAEMDDVDFEDYGDYSDDFADSNYATDDLQMGNAPDMRPAPANIQREYDEDYGDDFDEIDDEFDSDDAIDNAPSFNQSQPDNRNIQRESFTPDNEDNDFDQAFDAGDFAQSADQSPVQRESFTPEVNHYADDEEYDFDQGFDAGDFAQSADQSPVQRQYDEDFGEYEDADDHTDYDVYGDDSVGDRDYRSPSADSPIQRSAYEADDYYLDDDFDHLEDTDGMTAMNILEDYLSTREMPPVSNPSPDTSPQTPVQREHQDDFSGYDDNNELTDSQEFNLAGSFDPTPTANQNIQRSPQSADDENYRYDDYNYSDEDFGASQDIDLHQALSQAGMVPPPTSQPPIQRSYYDSDDDNYSYDEDAHGDYDDYGDATWAQLNNYAPATNAPTSDNSPVQRRPQYDNDDEEVSYPADEGSHNMQDIDLHQAMAQIGMAPPPSNPRPTNPPIQRRPQTDHTQDGGSQDEENFVNSQAMDLYQAMMGSGMISESEPAPAPPPPPSIQRKASPRQKSATDTPEESGIVSSSVSNANSGEPMDVVQRAEDNAPVTASESVSNLDENENESENDDQEYLSQLARDVYRIIKDKLRIENERRGR